MWTNPTGISPRWIPAAATAALALGLIVMFGGRALSRPAAAGPRLAHGLLHAQGPLARGRAEVRGFLREVPGRPRGGRLLRGRHDRRGRGRGPSVRDFDVALHLVFENKEAEAKYIKNPRHVQFVEENKASFAKVRVFDSYLNKP
ncbi:MAG: Dabb family protein [Isosphaeraceae bacterium]